MGIIVIIILFYLPFPFTIHIPVYVPPSIPSKGYVTDPQCHWKAIIKYLGAEQNDGTYLRGSNLLASGVNEWKNSKSRKLFCSANDRFHSSRTCSTSVLWTQSQTHSLNNLCCCGPQSQLRIYIPNSYFTLHMPNRYMCVENPFRTLVGSVNEWNALEWREAWLVTELYT